MDADVEAIGLASWREELKRDWKRERSDGEKKRHWLP